MYAARFMRRTCLCKNFTDSLYVPNTHKHTHTHAYSQTHGCSQNNSKCMSISVRRKEKILRTHFQPALCSVSLYLCCFVCASFALPLKRPFQQPAYQPAIRGPPTVLCCARNQKMETNFKRQERIRKFKESSSALC